MVRRKRHNKAGTPNAPFRRYTCVIDAWETLIRDHGTMDLGELLQPAIGYARDGYPVSSRVSVDFATQEHLLVNDPAAKRVVYAKRQNPGRRRNASPA